MRNKMRKISWYGLLYIVGCVLVFANLFLLWLPFYVWSITHSYEPLIFVLFFIPVIFLFELWWASEVRWSDFRIPDYILEKENGGESHES